jgi:hypothetical protein
MLPFGDYCDEYDDDEVGYVNGQFCTSEAEAFISIDAEIQKKYKWRR